jgi:hypothetical protein
MTDHGEKVKNSERYARAAHRVQSAVAFDPDRPRDPYKDLRTGLNLSKADQAGLVRLLIRKGVITEEEYVEAVATSAETEASDREDELSVRYGINISTM